MNKLQWLAVLLGSYGGSFSTALCNETPLAPSITISNNQAVVTWANGRPTYQLQSRSNFTDTWLNVGPPGFPALVDGVIVPFGTLTFRRLD